MLRYRLEIAWAIFLSLIILFLTLWITPIQSRFTTIVIETLFDTDFQYIQRVSPNVVGPIFKGIQMETVPEYDSIYVMDTEHGKFLVWEGRLEGTAGKKLFMGAILGTQDRCIRLNGAEPSRETGQHDFPLVGKHYPFTIFNEEQGYMIRTSMPVLDSTEAVSESDMGVDSDLDSFAIGILTLLLQYEVFFLLSVTLLQRKRRYHDSLLEVFDWTRKSYGQAQCRKGEEAYTKYVQIGLHCRLVVSLLTGVFLFAYLNYIKYFGFVLLSYLLMTGAACFLAIRAKHRLYQQSPGDLICCLTSVDRVQFQWYLLGVLGIGRFEEMLWLAYAFFLNGQPVQAWEVLNTAWHTMKYKTPANKLKAQLLRCVLFSAWTPERLEQNIPVLLRTCRRAPLTLFFVVGQGRMSLKGMKRCVQAFCTRNWADVVSLTDKFAMKKQASSSSVWLWVIRYQAAVACQQWDVAQEVIKALESCPGLAAWLNVAWMVGPEPMQRS